MADPKLSILTFPQKLIGTTLQLNVLIIPRNIDPFKPWAETGAPAWVDANLQLQAQVISGLEKFPFTNPAAVAPVVLSNIAMPSTARKMFEVLQTKFEIVDAPPGSDRRLQKPKPEDYARKYLPNSYRNSFNFTGVRTKDAVTDDSYLCAIKKNDKPDPAFVPSDNTVSWGEVFAYCLRQPALAEKVGFIQKSTIEIDNTLFKEGGWLFVDIVPDAHYGTAADKPFIKKYAARIPALQINNDRNLFAALQFPVKENEADPDPLGFDVLYPEASAYDDGFAKIVHANQPVNTDVLKEDTEDSPPIHDIGVRLAWDDEQLLIWLNRQLRADPNDPLKEKRLDAPLGVFQYHIDVKEKAAADWLSLTLVENKADLALDINDPETIIDAAGAQKELGVEVYPMKIDNRPTSHFWLPAYFTQWIGKSLVVPDKDAAELYKTDESGVPLGDWYNPVAEGNINLVYGNDYEFRVRFSDPTGGGPGWENDPINNPVYESPSPVGLCNFRRHVIPQPVLIQNVLPKKDGEFFEDATLELKRPRLGYPSVVFNGKYGANVIDLLKADRDEAAQFEQDAVTNEITKMSREFGLHDPDVESVEICVEVKSLEMDTLFSRNKTEAYLNLYTTLRRFDNAFDATLGIPIEYVDTSIIQVTDSPLLQDLGLSTEADPINIHEIDRLVLPNARDIRITLRAVCHNDINYFGGDRFRYGKPISFMVRKASKDETKLIKNQPDTEEIKAIYLQPDTELLATNAVFVQTLLKDNRERQTELIQRIADQLGLVNKGFSLLGKPGKRVQFGCCRTIRNSISPDGTSITFSTKADLLNHWIVPIRLLLNRDWTWDALDVVGFVIKRKQWLKSEEEPADYEIVGDIELKKIINLQALNKPERNQTHLVFLDAVEPRLNAQNHPDITEMKYLVEARFKADHAEDKDEPVEFALEVPVTIPPSQIPKIVSAGLAFSKYKRDEEKYSYSEPRQKFLWLEFDKPVEDPNDAVFVRMLAYAPDPLLSDWRWELFVAPKEPPLNIDPEPVRVITSNQPKDNSGIDAMQEMTEVGKSKVHYIVPLPHGLHPDSNELFGFFTYEVRIGHRHIWSTAQGRYGRPLRTTGVQHAFPTLFCTIFRNELLISVTAQFAMAVSNGKNVTSRPPRTQIWGLLYAQVPQADGKDYRNILLDDRLMLMQPGNPNNPLAMNEDAPRLASGGWLNKDVTAMLRKKGLPEDCTLSVVCVEMFPPVFTLLERDRKYFANITNTRSAAVASFDLNHALINYMQQRFQGFVPTLQEEGEQLRLSIEASNIAKPLSNSLGHHRILRTSPLTPVPEICCVDCD